MYNIYQIPMLLALYVSFELNFFLRWSSLSLAALFLILKDTERYVDHTIYLVYGDNYY